MQEELMEKLDYFLWLLIKQIETDTFITPTSYYLELLKKYDMKNLKIISIPMTSNLLINKYEQCIEIKITKYKGIIGSILYLTTSRPYIIFSVCMCAWFKCHLGNFILRSLK